MKEHAAKNKIRKHMGFYLVLLLCMAMISFACWFAYEQTKKEIVMDLDSAVGDIKVMEIETNVPKATQPSTERETTPTQPAAVQPLQTTPTETEPVTHQAAVVDAPETAPVIIESEQESTETDMLTQTAVKPSCYPLDGEILEGFSSGELVKSKTTGIWQTHNGIDIAGSLGDTVCAVADGTVKNIENDALWGVTVTIDHHNGIVSRYCNLNNGLSVSAGDKVEGGTVIGAVGDTADIESSMEAHLHFEVMQGERYIDPIEYLGNQTTESDTEAE